MEAIFALLGPSITGYIAAALGAGAALLALVFKSRATGRAQERAKQDAASLEAMRDRSKTDDTIQSLPADDRRRRLSGWVPDNKPKQL